jgi:transposase
MTHPRTLKFKPWQRHTLLDLRDHDPRPYVRERSAALLKISEGHSPHSVARHGLLKPRDPDTVYHWLDRFAAEGAEGLCQHQHGGNRRRSPLEAHRPELEERLRQAPAGASPPTERIPHRTPLPPSRWSLMVVRQHFDWLADYSLSGVWRVLQRCEIEWSKDHL